MNRPAFDPKELIPIGEEPAFLRRGAGRPIYDTPIAPKENLFMSLRHEKPLWMPMGDGTTMICPAVPDNIARAFVFETEKVPNEIGIVGGFDMFGVEWEYVPTAGGSMVRGGTPKVPDITEWEKYVTIPNLDEIIDWKTISERNKDYGSPRKALSVQILNGLFERLISFMDMSGALVALVDEDEQEGVHRLFDKLCDFYDDYMKHYVEYFHAEHFVFHDDWGSQRAPFFSLAAAREAYVDVYKKFNAHVKSLGLIAELHSCGKNDLVVPAYIESDFEFWNGMYMNDKRNLFEQYGDKFIFGVDPPAVADDMNASDEDLYAGAKEFCEFYIRDGKCHVVGNMMRKNPKFVANVYQISRQMLNA
jgi:hypothetical protein